jgi:hypothetical protein
LPNGETTPPPRGGGVVWQKTDGLPLMSRVQNLEAGEFYHENQK